MLVTMMLVLLLTIKKMDCGIRRNNIMERITQKIPKTKDIDEQTETKRSKKCHGT